MRCHKLARSINDLNLKLSILPFLVQINLFKGRYVFRFFHVHDIYFVKRLFHSENHFIFKIIIPLNDGLLRTYIDILTELFLLNYVSEFSSFFLFDLSERYEFISSRLISLQYTSVGILSIRTAFLGPFWIRLTIRQAPDK